MPNFETANIYPQGQILARILERNDRRGERAIALFQSLAALIIIVFHFISASKSNGATWSIATSTFALFILLVSALRYYLAGEAKTYWLQLNLMTILDGVLILCLIGSYSYAYDLSLASSFKSPSIVFLVLYTGIRMLKIDPVPIWLAGGTVLIGWFGLVLFVSQDPNVMAASYVDYITSDRVLLGSSIEVAVGFLALILALHLAASYARGLLVETANIEELTETKRVAENQLKRYQAILNSSIDGILIVDQLGIIEQTNPALEKIFGYELDSLAGKNVSTLMNAENASSLAAYIKRFNSGEISELAAVPLISYGIKKSGDNFPLELSINKFKVEGTLFFAGFVRDISDRLEAQRNEKSALSKFEDVVTSAMDAIVVIDSSGCVVEFNPAAEAIFGYSANEVIGKDMADFIIPDHHKAAHRDGMRHYLLTGEGPVLNQRVEIDAIRADGTSIMVELAIKESIGSEGSLFFGYIRDITEQKAAAESLIKAKERAEVANQAKASFLAMMSHEIRTPLNGVLGILTLLSDSVTDPKNSKLIGTARRSGRALLTIINDVLDFSKLEAGKFDLEIGGFYLNSFLDSVDSLVGFQVEEKKLELKFDVAANVPGILVGDQDRLRQVVLNLVWNAIKFTSVGEIQISVYNLDTLDTPHIRFEVRDTGIGIAQDKLDGLFTEFTTIDASYARKYGGTGLGLSICKALVVAMDGKIGVESEHNVGSTFWFEVPLKAGNERDVAPNDAQNDFTPLFEDDTKIRVLLVEDNPTNQLVAENMLEGLGCTVDVVSNGHEALSNVQAHKYDIVLMDISMPEMDGILATEHIRSLPGEKGQVPIIALTAYALDEDRQRALSAGMNGFVSKPIARIEMKRAIAKQLIPSKAEDASVSVQFDDPKNLVDLSVLSSTFNDMDIELQNRVTAQFRDDVERHLKGLLSAIKTGDTSKMEHSSHGLKGVAETFGATPLSNLAGTINTKTREGQTEQAIQLISELEFLTNATLAGLDKYIKLVIKEMPS